MIALESRILNYAAKGKKVELVYVIPDYQNPTGCSMPLANRHRLLKMAEKYDFHIAEDNAYNIFTYEGEKLPVIKSLDQNNRVIYIGSFAKSLFPGLRLGVIAANSIIQNKEGKEKLSDRMATIKGYLTVNSPSITQGILGGILIENNFSLKDYNKEKVAAIKQKRD